MPNAFLEIRPDEYAVAAEATMIGDALVRGVDSHAHLREARLGYLFRDEEIAERGKVIAASAHLGEFQGRFGRFIRWGLAGMLGFEPDFVILIDRNIWAGLDEQQRAALLDHELSHCAPQVDEDGVPKFTKLGEPKWMIRPHDVEEFTAVVERHGVWSPELAEMARAIVDSLSAREEAE